MMFLDCCDSPVIGIHSQCCVRVSEGSGQKRIQVYIRQQLRYIKCHQIPSLNTKEIQIYWDRQEPTINKGREPVRGNNTNKPKEIKRNLYCII